MLRYEMNLSLDGYVRDADGGFDWSEPCDELHRWWSEQERSAGIAVYGRRMWETMRYWQDPPPADMAGAVYREFRDVWREQHKIVVSRTLPPPTEPNTELWPELDLGRLAELVGTVETDVSISGPTLAAQALRAGLVDELVAVVVPYVAGGGLRFLPDGFSSRLRQHDVRRFAGGAVALSYRISRPAAPGAGTS